MPVKIVKKEDENSLTLERILYTKHYTLSLDRSRCIGCELCKDACPKEAIKIVKPENLEAVSESMPKKITVTVLEDKCNFCGICSEICIFGAFGQSVNGEVWVPVLKSESFPQIVHEVKVDVAKCPPGCRICEEECPLHLINVRFNGSGRVSEVNVDVDRCPGCRVCEVKCPYDAIHARKILTGSIKINSDICPEGCRRCVDACPIPSVLSISEGRKVVVNDLFCVYCGACRNACPVEGAIEIKRMSIRHAPVKSGAWNKALERLTSTEGMVKELRSKSTSRVCDSVRRLRVGGRVRR